MWRKNRPGGGLVPASAPDRIGRGNLSSGYNSSLSEADAGDDSLSGVRPHSEASSNSPTKAASAGAGRADASSPLSSPPSILQQPSRRRQQQQQQQQQHQQQQQGLGSTATACHLRVRPYVKSPLSSPARARLHCNPTQKLAAEDRFHMEAHRSSTILTGSGSGGSGGRGSSSGSSSSSDDECDSAFDDSKVSPDGGDDLQFPFSLDDPAPQHQRQDQQPQQNPLQSLDDDSSPSKTPRQSPRMMLEVMTSQRRGTRNIKDLTLDMNAARLNGGLNAIPLSPPSPRSPRRGKDSPMRLPPCSPSGRLLREFQRPILTIQEDCVVEYSYSTSPLEHTLASAVPPRVPGGAAEGKGQQEVVLNDLLVLLRSKIEGSQTAPDGSVTMELPRFHPEENFQRFYSSPSGNDWPSSCM
jgi:hypothetical protein